jgi:hypothetical protein
MVKGEEKVKTYKGFDKDLKCRGFQYEVGKEYEEPTASCCDRGFHACENPLDVLGYYDPANSRFCEVEQDGDIDKSDDDSKVASSKIKINAEIGLSGLINAGVKFTLDRVKKTNSNTGDRSASTNTGDYSASTNTGDYSASTNTGDRSASTNTGYGSASTNTGDRSASTNTGDRSASTNTGYGSASTNTGDRSASTNTGDYSASAVSGKGSVALVTGYKSKAKASIGSAVVICERGEWNGEDYPLLNIKSAIVDGKKLKADTFYTLENGKFVEADNDK